jgi:hypothetical protein
MFAIPCISTVFPPLKLIHSRTDYGILTLCQLTRSSDDKDELSRPALPTVVATAIMKALEDSEVISSTGVVQLEVTSSEITSAVSAAAATLSPESAQLLLSRRLHVDTAVKRARYLNLYELLGENIEV